MASLTSGKGYLPVVVFSLLCLIWGSTWMAIKIGLEDSPPFLSAGLRFVIAGAILVLIIKGKRLSLSFEPRVWRLMVLTGVLIGLGYGAVYWGEKRIPSGLTAVLFATLPLFVAIFSHLAIRDEKLNFTKVAGILIGFGGVVLIFYDNLTVETTKWLGYTSLLFSSAVMAAGSVLVKRDLTHVNPMVLTGVQMAIAAVLLLFIGAIRESVRDFLVTPNSMGALLYLSIIGTVIAFVIYYWLMQRIQVTRVSLIVLITPLVAIFLGWSLLGEGLNIKMIAGSVLVLGGVTIALR